MLFPIISQFSQMISQQQENAIAHVPQYSKGISIAKEPRLELRVDEQQRATLGLSRHSTEITHKELMNAMSWRDARHLDADSA